MRTYLEDFRDGVRSYVAAARLIRDLRLWTYVLVPGIISLLFAILVVIGARHFAEAAAEFIADRYPWERGAELVYRISGIVATILAWAAALIIYKYVILVLTAPFMAPLSERVERYLTGQQASPAFHMTTAIDQLVRGIRVALRNFFREILLSLFIIIVTAILPFLSVFTGPLIFLLQAYYAGFGNMDFTLERHFTIRQSADFVKSHGGLAIGNGIPFILLLAIPVVGAFLAPSLATIAGTVEVVKRLHPNRVR